MAKTAKFKNKSEQDLNVIGFGIVKSGETVELPEDFHNANFQKITRETREKEITDVKNKEIKETKIK